MPSSVLAAPPIIHELVAKFTEHRETYKAEKYNETQLRRDFLDPFFAAMGWDIDNRKGYAEKFREVIHEDAIKVEASVKAPDYCFRIGGQRIFFVEAKKPAVNIKDDIAPAFQLRRYAWTAKMPLSILTDFEELAVYDCRIKPDQKDKASTGRVMLLKYTDYVDKWQELCDIFSYDAIARGAFDKYAESNKKKRGTAEVDEAFLAEIEEWRESIAKNLSLRNKDLTDRELNTAVQLIIDRIIFLRLCEGRGIEPFGKLQSLLNGETVYQRLVEQFHKADEKYNSGLFHFTHENGREEPDALTTSLVVDDKVLKEIIRRLYYPDSPYEFAAMPAEILGQVYEQFLGKVIRLTKGHQAKIEEKPEVRKAGGVYYTPKYIVDYIVENTVGKLLESKTPQDIGGLTATYQPSKTGRPLTVLDPACGSGSFLIVAYQYLLDWYLKQYTEADKPEKHAKGANPRIYLRKENDWRLTTSERKRILLSHIYGVDIDYQAVEVTKLSLLLKVLEGETEETLQRQLFAKERALPDLANNIKCGNSLIGPDFYTGRQGELFDEEETLRINAFDWQLEFKDIFSSKNSGFDAVIGNPPYISAMLLSESLHPDVKVYWKKRYSCAQGAYDIYILFIEKAAAIARDGSNIGFIIPNKFLAAEYAQAFRSWVLESLSFTSLLDLSRKKVWKASVYPVVVTFKKSDDSSALRVFSPGESGEICELASVKSKHLSKVPDNLWSFVTQPGAELLLKCLSVSESLESISEICSASTVAEGSEYPKLLSNGGSSKLTEEQSKFVVSGSVHRYFTTWQSEPVQFTGQKYTRPVIALKSPMPTRRILQAKTPKLVICKVALVPRAYFDTSGDYTGAYTTYVLNAKVALQYLAGLINSSLMAFLYRRMYDALAMGGGYLRFQAPQIRRLPIRIADDSYKAFSDIVIRSDALSSLYVRLAAAKTAHERTALERQIAATDREIDQLVYELYGLTDKEIALVEEATAEK